MFLETKRLLLREFVEDDWKAVIEYQRDPLYLRYYAWEDRDEFAVREFVGWFISHQKEHPRTKFQLAVTLKSDGILIGNCGIRVNDQRLREGSIGFELSSRYWGIGIATEAATEILRFGFEELKLHRIWSWCVEDNTGSARVLQKSGMREEGCRREAEAYKGRWWSHRLFAILESEWNDKIAADSTVKHSHDIG